MSKLARFTGEMMSLAQKAVLGAPKPNDESVPAASQTG
jgi:hypothetical protein